MTPTRRDLLRMALAAMGALVLPESAEALGDRTRFRFGHLRIGPGWDPHPGALGTWAQELRLRTSIDVRIDREELGPGDKALFRHPFLVWTGDRETPRLGDRDIERLRRVLSLGGFLFIDNGGRTQPSARFEACVRAEDERRFRQRPLKPIPIDHVLHRSFYRIDRPLGRRATKSQLEGVELDRRYVVVYSSNDLLGAYQRDRFGGFELEAAPGGEAQREQAFRLGINLVLYALCLDYKDDQTHVNHLLKKRRWRPGSPSGSKSPPPEEP